MSGNWWNLGKTIVQLVQRNHAHTTRPVADDRCLREQPHDSTDPMRAKASTGRMSASRPSDAAIRAPAPASPLSSAHPAGRAPAPPGVPGAPEHPGAPGNAPPRQHPPCRQPTRPGGPRRRLVSRGHRNRPAPAATRPRTSIPPVVSPPSRAGPGAAWCPGGPGTGRRLRQRTPAPASPLSSAHPAGRAPAPPGVPGAPEQAGATGNAPPHQHPPCRQPTRPGGPRRRLASRGHRNGPAPAATRPRASISPVVSPPSLAGPGAAWCPGGTGTGRRLRQRTPAPASPLSSAHPAWRAPAPPGVPGAPEQAGAPGNAPPHQHPPCRQPTQPGGPRRRLASRGPRNRPAPAATRPRTGIPHVVSPPSRAGPGAAWRPGGTGTGRRLRQRAPAPASPMSSAHPAWRAQAPPGVPGAPEQAGACGNAPPHQHPPCRQPTQPGGPRRRLVSRGHRNRPAPAATRPRTRIPHVVSPPSRAGPGAAWRPGGTGTGRRLRQRTPAPASPLSPAHPAGRAPAPPGVPEAPEQAGACGNAPPHQHLPCRQPTRPGGPRRRLVSRGHRNRPAPAATRPRTSISPVVSPPSLAGPGAARRPGGTGTGRRLRPRTPAPASPLSSAHPAWRAPAPPGVPGAPEHPGACGNAPPHRHPPCRQPTQPGGPRRRQASRGHRNRPAPAATRPSTSISPVVSPPSLAGPGAAWRPGGTGTGRRLRQRAPAPASPLSSAHTAGRAPAPPGVPGAPEQAGACGNAPPHQHPPCRQPTRPGGARRRLASRGTGTGRRPRQRAPAPASPLSSAHPAWRAPAPPGVPGAPEQAGACGHAPPHQHPPCRQPTQPGGPRRRLASRGHRNRPAPAATRPRTGISPVVSPPSLAGPGAAWPPGGTGTGRRPRQRAPAPASPLSSAHPAWRAPAPPGAPGAPEQAGAPGNAPPHQHLPCRQPTQPGGPRRRLASRGHRNRPAPPATRPRTSISHVVSPPSLAGPGAAWRPGGTGTGRRLRQRAPAPASPLSSAHPAWRTPPPPGVPGAPEQAGAPGNAPPHQHLPCRQPTQPGGPRRRLASRGHRNRPAPAATRPAPASPLSSAHPAWRAPAPPGVPGAPEQAGACGNAPRTSISPVVSPPSLAGPGAAWRPGGTGTGRRLRQRAPAPASPLSSAHPAWRARRRLASRGHRNRPAPAATHPRTSISPVVSPPSLAGPGAARCPGDTGTGRRLRPRAPAPASPLSSAHPAGRAPAAPGAPGAPEQAGACGNAPPHQHLPCRQPTRPGGPRRRLASRGHRIWPAPAATRPRTSIPPVVSPPGLAGPGAAWCPGGTGTGRRLRQRTPAPASPLSSAHPAWRAPAPPGLPGAPEQAGACGNAPPHQHLPCRQPTQPGGPRRRPVSRGHRNRPAPAATRPRTSISHVVSPPGLADPGAAWRPGGTGTGRRPRQRAPAPASPLSSAHPAWRAQAPPGLPGAPEQAGACGNAPPHQHLPCRQPTRPGGAQAPPGLPGAPEQAGAPGNAPPHQHLPCRQPTRPGGPRRRLVSRGHRNRPAPPATRPRTSISPVVHRPRRAGPGTRAPEQAGASGHAPPHQHSPCRPPTLLGGPRRRPAREHPGADPPRSAPAQAGAPQCSVRRSFQPRRRNPSRGPRAARRLLDILRYG